MQHNGHNGKVFWGFPHGERREALCRIVGGKRQYVWTAALVCGSASLPAASMSATVKQQHHVKENITTFYYFLPPSSDPPFFWSSLGRLDRIIAASDFSALTGQQSLAPPTLVVVLSAFSVLSSTPIRPPPINLQLLGVFLAASRGGGVEPWPP